MAGQTALSPEPLDGRAYAGLPAGPEWRAAMGEEPPLSLRETRILMADELAEVDRFISRRLKSHVALVDQIAHYLINAGGKRLRPLTVLIAARACGYPGGRHVEAAAIVEFVHTATLLHDDVVDSSVQRRGRKSANTIWGNQASILVGDFLYSRSFQMMVDLNDMRVMRVMADATNAIAEGEVLQLAHCHDPDTTEDRYLDVIYGKTAKLFEAGAQIAAIMAKQSDEIERGMMRYGKHLGTAYQLIDDALDFTASPDDLGKNLGDDLAEGQPTLPLIFAIANGSQKQRSLIRNAIVSGGIDELDEISAAIESTGALEYTNSLARREAEAAVEGLADLPDTDYKRALIGLAEFAVRRRF